MTRISTISYGFGRAGSNPVFDVYFCSFWHRKRLCFDEVIEIFVLGVNGPEMEDTLAAMKIGHCYYISYAFFLLKDASL